MQKEAFVEKHVALITPSTSFLNVYKDKMSVSEICAFPSVRNWRSATGVMYCNVEQQMFHQIFNAS